MTLHTQVSFLLAAISAAPTTAAGIADGSCAVFELHNNSGCTSAGHYQATKSTGPDACCALCANQTRCMAWSFHAGGADCYLATDPRLATPVTDTTCGCRHAGCSPGPPPPPPAPVKCIPPQRPPQPKLFPLPPGKVAPHIVTVLVDDLGFDVSGELCAWGGCWRMRHAAACCS